MFFSFPLIIIFSLIFTRITHPLSTGLVLLVQTILISVRTGLFKCTYWFSYILFLIFLGGILVLFIYVTSLAANEQFKFKREFIFMALVFMFVSLLSVVFDPIYLTNKFDTSISSLLGTPVEIRIASLRVRMIYNKPRAFFTLFVISYLLLALFVIVKIIRSSSNPLRLETYDNPAS